jgi:hypothetical protein
MALQDLVLKRARILLRNLGIGQDAKTRIHSVHSSVVTNDIGYVLLAGFYPFDGGA